VWEQRIYEAAVSTLLDVISEVRQASSVLLIGHNPGFEELVSFLSEADYLQPARCAIPTAGLVSLAMPNNWQQLDPGCAVFKQMNQPTT
jgi:phosphohistidine phosphatase